ncbi:unnamed protein product [Zymoseptoria tritici ST99CH_1A5]|uniref:Ubiquitin-like protease family profile domain-containing protein n=2 Tax=Zymoseptoria tritici TaxID=1047171 RepID=A0A2H1HBT1_ZYMTR|nr:unnamed protein product [Zymoseptoria tritici ST99CH_1E4]SMY30618.1 unnamed protein product [Zymoseptoria tritici ST99CH_1A5]
MAKASTLLPNRRNEIIRGIREAQTARKHRQYRLDRRFVQWKPDDVKAAVQRVSTESGSEIIHESNADGIDKTNTQALKSFNQQGAALLRGGGQNRQPLTKLSPGRTPEVGRAQATPLPDHSPGFSAPVVSPTPLRPASRDKEGLVAKTGRKRKRESEAQTLPQSEILNLPTQYAMDGDDLGTETFADGSSASKPVEPNKLPPQPPNGSTPARGPDSQTQGLPSSEAPTEEDCVACKARCTAIEQLLPTAWLGSEAIDQMLNKFVPNHEEWLVLQPNGLRFRYADGTPSSVLGRLKESHNNIIAPANLTENHWTIVRFDLSTHTIHLYDPYGDDQTLNDLKEEILAFLKTRPEFPGIRWRYVYDSAQLQRNCVDCGVFTIAHALHWMYGFPLERDGMDALRWTCATMLVKWPASCGHPYTGSHPPTIRDTSSITIPNDSLEAFGAFDQLLKCCDHFIAYSGYLKSTLEVVSEMAKITNEFAEDCQKIVREAVERFRRKSGSLTISIPPSVDNDPRHAILVDIQQAIENERQTSQMYASGRREQLKKRVEQVLSDAGKKLRQL